MGSSLDIFQVITLYTYSEYKKQIFPIIHIIVVKMKICMIITIVNVNNIKLISSLK